VSRRKTAQRGPAKKAEPESNRLWLIVNRSTGRPTIGCDNASCRGIRLEYRARRIADQLAIDADVVLRHEFYGEPDPDAVDE
jgi:hypothetical protein